MQILVNGIAKQASEEITLQLLLDEYHINPKTVIVELNREVVARSDYGKIELSEGDRLEMVRLVGGG